MRNLNERAIRRELRRTGNGGRHYRGRKRSSLRCIHAGVNRGQAAGLDRP